MRVVFKKTNKRKKTKNYSLKLGVVVHACGSSIWQVEAEVLTDFKVGLINYSRPYLKSQGEKNASNSNSIIVTVQKPTVWNAFL